MDHPDLMGNYIGPKRDKQDRYYDLEANSNANSLNCMSGSRGGGEDRVSRPRPWKITRLLGFLAILVPVPWKIT